MEQQIEKKIKYYGRRQSSSTSKSNSSFPLDLASEILLKLPAKSIARSRCVSKLWSSTTTDPYFINSFGTRSSLNPSLLIILKKSNKIFVFCFPKYHQYSNHGFSYSSSQHVDRYQMKYRKSISLSSMESVHGLIYFRTSEEPIIWNPTIRQFFSLPKPEKSWMKRSLHFLGYDPIDGKHKVVCIPREEVCDECLVLTLGLSSARESYWRRIKTNHYHRPITGISRAWRCINGVLYYKAFDLMKNQVVVSFDVRSEKFQPIIMLPLNSKAGLLIAYEGRLAFVNSFYENNSEFIKLSVLEDAEKEEWSHKSIHVPLSSFDSSLKTRFRLIGVSDGGEFIYIPSTILKSFCILYFDPKRDKFRKDVFDGIADDEFRLSNGLGDSPFEVLHAFPNHIESLISLGADVCVDKPNPWEFDITQFDDILKKLKAVTNTRASAAKQGLGIKNRPKKVSGVRCEGKKTSFDNPKDTVIKTSLPAKRKREEIIQEPKIKLKNLCKQILKKHSQDGGGSMKLKQLKSLIDEQAPSLLLEFSSRKDAIAYLKLKLERSEKFVVDGKKISLVSRKK